MRNIDLRALARGSSTSCSRRIFSPSGRGSVPRVLRRLDVSLAGIEDITQEVMVARAGLAS